MPLDFEELDYAQTPLGDLILRRRRMRSLDNLEVYEVILGTGYLMSSLFTTVEIALADLGLAMIDREQKLDIVVGGLGLGYTAQAALKDERVNSLLVIDALPQVIGWHRKGLVPLGEELTNDQRCQFVENDFFLAAHSGFDPDSPQRRFHAVLLDIDHSPRNLIHEQHGGFYTTEGLQALAHQLLPRGVFAMWSDDPPDDDFMALLRGVFPETSAEIVAFHNPIQDKESRSTVYLCQLP